MRGLLLLSLLAGCAERALPLPDEPTTGDADAGARADLASERKPLGAFCNVGADCQSGQCDPLPPDRPRLYPGVCGCSRTVCGGACVDLDHDGANCGACGHGCGGDPCARGQCQPVVALDGVLAPYALAVDEDAVYLRTEDQQVSRVPARGGKPTSLARADGGEVAVDAAFVYYTDHNGGAVYK